MWAHPMQKKYRSLLVQARYFFLIDQVSCLLLHKLEVAEIHLLLCARGVGQAEFGGCHAAQFVARMDDGVVVAVVQEGHLDPVAVHEAVEGEVLGCAGHAQVEV